MTLASSCSPSTPPGGPTARSLAGGCVLHVDARADRVPIDDNVKVFTAVRDDATRPGAANFGDFRLVGGPFGSTLVARKADGLPSVYALTETWFRGSGFNEALRAQVVPRRLDPRDTGSGATVLFDGQDFTGSWNAPQTSNSSYFGSATVDPLNNRAVDDPLPQWLQVGVANPQMFACTGLGTENLAQPTTWLMGVTPSGTTGQGSSISRIQDVLNGDRYFTHRPNSEPIGGALMAPPVPGMSGPAGNGPSQGTVSCAMTQTGDNTSSRELHLLAFQNRQLQYATLSNFGPVTQLQESGNMLTFSRFRTASQWVDVLQSFPEDYGELVHLSALATGTDRVLHVFFVARRNDGGQTTYRLWHTRQLGTGSWTTPVDVLRSSGETSTGRVNDMAISTAFCPAFGDNLGTQPGAEILIAWVDVLPLPEERTIGVIQVERPAKTWFPGGPRLNLFSLEDDSTNRDENIWRSAAIHSPSRSGQLAPVQRPVVGTRGRYKENKMIDACLSARWGATLGVNERDGPREPSFSAKTCGLPLLDELVRDVAAGRPAGRVLRGGAGEGGVARISRAARRVGKGAFAPCPPSINSVILNGGHASLCPPYVLLPMNQ